MSAKLFTPSAFAAGLMLGAGVFTGCSAPVANSFVENIQCRYSFTGVEQKAERERIYGIAKQYATSNSLQPTEVPQSSNFDLNFVVPRLQFIDQMHGPIIFFPSSDPKAPMNQVFNSHDPTFSITYNAATISAKIEVIVNFTITPGAQLFYKSEGDSEKDISNSVGGDGAVSFKTTIRKGQDYIYGRTVFGNIVRYIRINVYTQEVQQINRSDYP